MINFIVEVNRIILSLSHIEFFVNLLFKRKHQRSVKYNIWFNCSMSEHKKVLKVRICISNNVHSVFLVFTREQFCRVRNITVLTTKLYRYGLWFYDFIILELLTFSDKFYLRLVTLIMAFTNFYLYDGTSLWSV